MASTIDDIDFSTTAVCKIDVPHHGDVSIFMGDPQRADTPHQDVSAMSPDEQERALRLYGKTHVFCHTYWDRGLHTVEEYIARLRELVSA